MSKRGKVQFFHHPEGYRQNRYTAAVELPDNSYFVDTVNSLISGKRPNDVEIKVGLATVHPKDRYDHMVGILTSFPRLTSSLFRVLRVCFTESGKAVFILSKHSDMITLEVHVRTDINCTPCLIDVYGTAIGGY